MDFPFAPQTPDTQALREKTQFLQDALQQYSQCFPTLAKTGTVLHQLHMEDVQQGARELLTLLSPYLDILRNLGGDRRRQLLSLLSDTAAVLSLDRGCPAYLLVAGTIQQLL